MAGASVFWGLLMGGFAAWQARRKGKAAGAWFIVVAGLVIASSLLGLGLMEENNPLGPAVMSLGAVAGFVTLLIVSFGPYRCKKCGGSASKDEYITGRCSKCRPLETVVPQ